jgi:hypothetical protein
MRALVLLFASSLALASAQAGEIQLPDNLDEPSQSRVLAGRMN